MIEDLELSLGALLVNIKVLIFIFKSATDENNVTIYHIAIDTFYVVIQH